MYCKTKSSRKQCCKIKGPYIQLNTDLQTFKAIFLSFGYKLRPVYSVLPWGCNKFWRGNQFYLKELVNNLLSQTDLYLSQSCNVFQPRNRTETSMNINQGITQKPLSKYQPRNHTETFIHISTKESHRNIYEYQPGSTKYPTTTPVCLTGIGWLVGWLIFGAPTLVIWHHSLIQY